MNSTLRRSALAVLLLGSVSPAIAGAAPDVQASFTLGTGIFDYDSTDGDISTDGIVTAAASLRKRFDAWSAQVDFTGEWAQVNSEDYDLYDSMQGIGGHVTYNFGGAGTLGAFAGWGTGRPTDEEAWSGAWYGLEGQYFCDDLTFYGQAAILDISDHGGEGEGFDDNAYLFRGVVRYFVTDDTKLELELARVEGDGVIDTDDDDGEATEWGVSAQTRIAEMPLYASIAYRGGNYDATTEDDDAQVHMLTFGLSYMFGTPSLKANDRDGTSLDTPTTPLRSAGIFSELD